MLAVTLLQELFDLKTAENTKLSEDLADTIKQLEEKSAVLHKTQEEKEVQVWKSNGSLYGHVVLREFLFYYRNIWLPGTSTLSKRLQGRHMN